MAAERLLRGLAVVLMLGDRLLEHLLGLLLALRGMVWRSWATLDYWRNLHLRAVTNAPLPCVRASDGASCGERDQACNHGEPRCSERATPLMLVAKNEGCDSPPPLHIL